MMAARLDSREALQLLEEAPLLELMERADAARRKRWPGQEVTFVIDTNPNYTNVCVTACSFCSFYRKPGHPEAFTLSPEGMAEKAAAAQAAGATTILLQGGHNPELDLDWYLRLIAAIQHAAPGMHLHLLSPAEVDFIARQMDMGVKRVLKILWDAGLRTMPGGGAEILVERVRQKVSPAKITAERWLDIMRYAHETGMKTSATMTYGHIETDEDIIIHLLRLRELQEDTGGFYAFIPWSFKPGASRLSREVPEEELSGRYIRIIAIARLVLDNFPHIQASWFGEGWRAGQLALHAGADDFGGVLLEENVLAEAGHRKSANLESVLRTIRGAGFRPVQRNTFYKHTAVFPEKENAVKIEETP